jgi:preprotein translocase subunit SecD
MRIRLVFLCGLIASGMLVHACKGEVKPDPDPGQGTNRAALTNALVVAPKNGVAENTNKPAESLVLRLVRLSFMVEDNRPDSQAPRRLVLGSGVRIRLEPTVLFRNEDLEDGYIQYDEIFEQHVLWLRFTPVAALRFAAVTKGAVGRRLAILLDDEIWVAPLITEEIRNGTAIVAGRTVQPRLRGLAERLKQVRGQNR